MRAEEVTRELREGFGHSPTSEQEKAFRILGKLLVSEAPRPTLVIRGAAGTGKTTLMHTLVRWLADQGIRAVLLAPTGRAAKVLAARTGRNASTIHKYIYQAESETGGSVRFRLNRNEDPAHTCYIVDEASMLGNEPGISGNYQSRPLLEDLVQFVFEGSTARKLIFLGDLAQLPPVGSLESPALSIPWLREQLDLQAGLCTLTEVKRQLLESPILANATALRQVLDKELRLEALKLVTGPDCYVLEQPAELVDLFCDLYNPEDLDRVLVVCHSNGMATQLNEAIRQRLYHEPEFLMRDDVALVVKNYYQRQHHELPFVANGDLGRVQQVYYRSKETRFGLEWCDADIVLTDLDGQPQTVAGKVPISLLTSKQPALSLTETRHIWQERLAELKAEKRSTQKADLRKDPYIQCLQLKYGYAVTAHKAQGGQWDTVIVYFEPWLFKEGKTDELLRWAYTAITRAARRLVLVNCPFPVA
ncbi:MAG: AAA family ATPase [Bacteroidetes bacterium]|nr:AAA family ATPase [Bacteroidota bacterium]